MLLALRTERKMKLSSTVVALLLGSALAGNCTFHEQMDCEGNDIVMHHGFGLNASKCCDLCGASADCAVAVLALDQGGVCMLKSGCSPKAGSSKRTRCTPANKPPLPPSPPAPTPLPVAPSWSPTYRMNDSTVIMPCNYSGFYDFSDGAGYPQLGRFGLVDYDWSNAKLHWANQSPMTCQGDMLRQAAANKAANPAARVFHYRNIVKALPWFEEVREKLADPAYWGWFVHLREDLRNGTTAGGNLYHDEEQTPGWPGGGNGGPDGVCHNNTSPPWGRACDCGDDFPRDSKVEFIGKFIAGL